MNNETEQSLGVRAVACKGFLWMPGMLAMYTWGGTARDRFLCADDDGVHMVVESKVVGEGEPLTWLRKRPASFARDCLPDLDDPATLGCIEHGLLPEMYGDDCNLASWVAADGSTRWTLEYTPDPCSSPHQRVSVSDDGHESKGEALVFALEAAP